ncbi:MAG: hypothetical protein BMS9Abin13_102 [Patescibacteria group bacterium]|nr:MAG: hypothetical protein BMS9Abin13_102 [Patescibacteria group bacterium]
MSKVAKKVLIVEDDESISRIYDIKLKKEGVETLIVADGEVVLEKLPEFKPDLILLDLMLPKRDGFWVLEHIRKSPDFKETPVVVLSNLGQESDKEKAEALGVEDYLVKANISIREATRRIMGYLNHSAASGK